MKNVLLLALGTLFLIAMVGLSSFVSAAPPSDVPPTPEVIDDGASTTSAEAAVPAAPIDPGKMVSRILVFNPDTTGVATVRIQIVNPNGQVVAKISDFTVPVDGVAAKPLPTSIGSPFSGSALVSSDKNVQAFVTNYNSTQGARDEYAGTVSPATTLTLPFVRHIAPNTQNSVIAVQNTGATSTTITLKLYDRNGALLPDPQGTTAIADVAPWASAIFNTNSIFPAGTFVGSASVTADGTIALAGTEQNRFMKDTASFRALTPTDQGMTLTVNYVERTASTTGVVTSWNELYVRNEGSNPTTIRARYINTLGATRYTTQTLTAIQPNGIAVFNTKAAGFSGLGTAFKGWVQLTSLNNELISAYSLESWSSTRLFGSEAVPEGQRAVQAVCGDVFRNATQTSRINILNTGTTTASVRVIFYNPTTGTGVGSKTVSIAPNRVVTVLANDAAFVNAGTAFNGLALVTSTGANAPKIITTVFTPFINAGVNGGVTSYACSKMR